MEGTKSYSECVSEFNRDVFRLFRFVAGLWVLLQLATLIFGSPLAFQRLGALWVSCSIFFLGFYLWGLGDTRRELDLFASNSEMSERQLRRAKSGLYRVFRHTAMAPLFTPESFDEMPEDQRRRLSELLSDDIRETAALLGFADLTFAALGTLQSGYGDLFFCLFRGATC